MNKVLYFIIFTLIVSCAKEEFGETVKTNSEAITNREVFSNLTCAGSTLIKPPVDFLFVFDNSTSTNYINAETKSALLGTLTYVSERFDYHVMVAPLLRNTSDVNQGVSLAVSSTDGLSASATSLVVANDSSLLLDRAASISSVPGSAEYGFERVSELISTNRSNGIFRDNAYTIVVMISNEDADWRQSGPDIQGPGPEINDYSTNYTTLTNLSNSLSAEQFRLMSVVPFTDNCEPSYKQGWRYKKMSRDIYLHNLNTKTGFSDPDGAEPYDSFDLCSGDFASIFNSINQTINSIVISHVYNYWPVAANNSPAFDPQTIRVFKVFSDTSSVELSENTVNGWQYIGYRSNQNLRTLPSPGEPFTGNLLQLHGNAQLTYPECINVQTLAPADYYGYVVTSQEPRLDTVRVIKNGQTYNQSATNGWEYIGFRSSFNIRIQGSGNYSAGVPAVNRTGYVFKLNGAAVYSNGDEVQVLYNSQPAN